MDSTKFVSRFGNMYDLFFLYKLYFNKAEWMSEFALHKKVESDNLFYERTVSEFGEFPAELKIFCTMNEDDMTFLDTLYFDLLEQDIELTFQAFSAKLEEEEFLKQQVFHFYLGIDITSKTMVEIAEKVDGSYYSEEIKHLLLSFYIKPEKYQKALIYDLISKEAMLTNYYQRNFKTATKAQETFEEDDIDSLVNSKKETLCSIALIAKNMIIAREIGEYNVVILGSDYREVLQERESDSETPDLIGFGKVMSEQNRVVILDMLLEHKELSTSDIARRLKVSVNAAYYHLNMMTDIDMLFSRNEGRTAVVVILELCVQQFYFVFLLPAILECHETDGECYE